MALSTLDSSVLAAHSRRLQANAAIIQADVVRRLEVDVSPRVRQAMDEIEHDVSEVAHEVGARVTRWRLRLHRFFLWEDKIVTGAVLGALHVMVWEGWLVGTLHLLLAGILATGLAHTFKGTAEGEWWKRLQVHLDPSITQEAVGAFLVGITGVGTAACGLVAGVVTAMTPPTVEVLNMLMAWENTRASLRLVAYLWVGAQVVAFWQSLHVLTFRTPTCLLWTLAVNALFAAGWFIANPAAGTITTEEEIAQFKAKVHTAAVSLREWVAPVRKLRAQVDAALPAVAADTASGVPTALLVALVAMAIDSQLNTLHVFSTLSLSAWAICLWDATHIVDAVGMLADAAAKASKAADPAVTAAATSLGSPTFTLSPDVMADLLRRRRR